MDPIGPYISGNLAIADGDWEVKTVPLGLLDYVALTLPQTSSETLPTHPCLPCLLIHQLAGPAGMVVVVGLASGRTLLFKETTELTPERRAGKS